MNKEKMLHCQCGQGDVGEYILLPGDPSRSAKIADHFDNSVKIAQNREHITYTGYLDNVKVSVTSTGMGGPSTSIVVEELAALGGRVFIRVGTCGSTSELVCKNDVIVPNGAVRMEGTGAHYLPMEFPAVPDFSVLLALKQTYEKLELQGHVGVTITKDSFTTQVAPETKPVGYELIQRWKSYELGGAICTAMEDSVLFLLGASLGVRTGSVLGCANDYHNSTDSSESNKLYESNAILVGVEALRLLIRQDKALNDRKV